MNGKPHAASSKQFTRFLTDWLRANGSSHVHVESGSATIKPGVVGFRFGAIQTGKTLALRSYAERKGARR